MTAPIEAGHGQPRALAALRVAAIVAIQAACVLVLHQLGRYPWMRVDWSDLGHWLEASPAEDVLLGGARTVALVLAWWLLVSSLLYVGAAVANAPRALSFLRWALLPIVRRVLDGALALTLTGGAALPSTVAMPATASVETNVGAIHPTPARPPDSIALKLAIYRAAAPLPAPTGEAPTYEVQPGDSLWEIAEHRLGNPTRWTEIWELNRARLEASGAASPHVLQVGWVLELPSPAEAAGDSSGSYTVQPGDTLWSIADRELHDPARIDDILMLNLGRPQPDGGMLVDPDLIRPGWQLDMPTRPDHERGPAPAPPAPESPEATAEPRPQPPAESLEPERPSASVPDRAAPAPTPTAPPARPDRPPDPEPSSRHGPPAANHDQQPRATETDAPPTLPVVAGLTGATVLATGLMLQLRRMRRRRATATARARSTWRRQPTEVEQAIVAAADMPLVRWAGQELASLATRLRARDLDGAAPVAIELSTDSGIELLWDRPVPHTPPPTPWSVRDGGWAWSLPYDPDAPVPADARPAPLPALVTIGEREGRQLLLDLEAYGSVAVTGEPQRVVDFARAVGLELATDDDLSDAVVSTVGVEIPGADHLVRLVAASTAEAHGALRTTVTSVGHTLERAGLTSSFEFRVGRNAPHLETVVVIADASAPGVVPSELIAASPPRQGAAAVLLGDADATATIVIASGGSARLDPLGVEFQAAALPSPGHEQVDQLLVDEATGDHVPPPTEPQHEEPAEALVDPATGGNGHQPSTSGPDPVVAEPVATADTVGTISNEPGNGAASGAGNEPDPRPGRIMVRVLGRPRVDERPDLRRRELALVVYLACRGGPVQASSIQHAIWGGRAVQDKTLWNLITRTRATIGAIDGEPALPPADRSRNTLALSDRLTTDLAVFRWLYERALESPSARAIELLREALALVEGEPFDAPGYDWAHHDHQYVAEASALIEQAVELLVGLATQAGDVDVARDALVRGLRGVPGNEVLYRARMHLEHDAGNLAGVKTAWDELVGYLDDLYTEPSEATELLYRELVRATRR